MSNMITVESLTIHMLPGEYYSFGHFLKRGDYRRGVVQTVLTRAIDAGVIVRQKRGDRCFYCIRSIEVPCAPDRRVPAGELKGYDAQLRELRALCEIARGNSNGAR